jgi:hypothetical protein
VTCAGWSLMLDLRPSTSVPPPPICRTCLVNIPITASEDSDAAARGGFRMALSDDDPRGVLWRRKPLGRRILRAVADPIAKAVMLYGALGNPSGDVVHTPAACVE